MNETNPVPPNTLQNRHDNTVAELSRYKLLIESIQDYAIFLMDPTGHIQTWNKGAEINKGYKPHEIIGKHFSVFYSDDDNAADKPARELVIASKVGRIEDEDWRIRKDGSKFWANVVITALHDEDGQLVGFAKVTRNLTDRKHQEDELRRANLQLRQQQQQMQVLNESKDEFISLASHQLRTPATAVKLLLGTLINDASNAFDPNTLKHLQKAYDSNERQIAIVNSLLKVAQIDSGKVVLRRTEVDISKMVRHIIEEQNDTFEYRNQTVKFESDNLATALVDLSHMRMAIENIVENASKYTSEGGKIDVSVAEGNGFIEVSIRDNGVGIEAGDIETLFDKFNRIPNELTHRAPGSGLGLYWSRKVIELHGGNIKVESELGKGSNFIIRIPKGGDGA